MSILYRLRIERCQEAPDYVERYKEWERRGRNGFEPNMYLVTQELALDVIVTEQQFNRIRGAVLEEFR